MSEESARKPEAGQEKKMSYASRGLKVCGMDEWLDDYSPPYEWHLWERDRYIEKENARREKAGRGL